MLINCKANAFGLEQYANYNLSENQKFVCVIRQSPQLIYLVGPEKMQGEFSKENYPISGVYKIEGKKIIQEVKNLSACRPFNDGNHYVGVRQYGEIDYSYETFLIFNKEIEIFSIALEEFCKKYTSYPFGSLDSFGKSGSYWIDNSNNSVEIKACEKKFIYSVDSSQLKEDKFYISGVNVFFVLLLMFFLAHFSIPFILFWVWRVKVRKKSFKINRKLKILVISFFTFILVVYGAWCFPSLVGEIPFFNSRENNI